MKEEKKRMEELINICTYKEFKAATDREVLNQAEGFVRLGYLLRKARDTEILRDSGYPTVVAFAEGEYGLTETYVSRYIAINKRYSQDGYSPYLQERFQGYGMAKLAEMLTLSDEVVEALPPELSKTEIQEVKREIRKEQEITDLEVMLEETENGSEEKSSLEKWLQVYIQENKEEWSRAKKQMPGSKGKEREEEKEGEGEEEVKINWVMDFLAPTGIAAKMARIKGEGKFMLTIKGKYSPLELLNLRTNEKETYTLTECAELMESIRMREGEEEKPEQKQEKPEQEQENLVRNSQKPEQEKETKRKDEASEAKLAPVQEMAENEEPPKAKEETQSEKRQTIAEEEKDEGRQMEVEDYPEFLPEGYTPTAYIKCHDGSEVEEKEWREAKVLIGKMYEDTAMENWNLEEVYRKAKKLVIILEKLHKER